jgi:Zn-dependent protease with chaperone function
VTPLLLLGVGLAAFMTTPWVLRRLKAAPPNWRVRLAFLAILSIGASVVSLLGVLVVPEAIVVWRVSNIWEVCSRAIHELLARPLLRIPSIAAGGALGAVLGRFGWALVTGFLASARARVRTAEPRWRLGRGEPVFIASLESPTAYSVGARRGQVVLSHGLLEILDPQEFEAVLLHEEGHLRARHHGKLMAARAIRASLGFLPPVRAVLGLLEQAMEEAADEHAAQRLGDRATVGSALAKAGLSSLGRPVGALALTEGLDVPGRVRRLLEPPEVPTWVPWACLALAGILLASLALAQAMAGLAILAATHHMVGLGTAALCPLVRAGIHAAA